MIEGRMTWSKLLTKVKVVAAEEDEIALMSLLTAIEPEAKRDTDEAAPRVTVGMSDDRLIFPVRLTTGTRSRESPNVFTVRLTGVWSVPVLTDKNPPGLNPVTDGLPWPVKANVVVVLPVPMTDSGLVGEPIKLTPGVVPD